MERTFAAAKFVVIFLPFSPLNLFSLCCIDWQDSHMCAVLVSEENENPIIVEESKSGQDYLVRPTSIITVCD